MNAVSVSRVRRTPLLLAIVVVAALTSFACSKKDEPVATVEAPKAAASPTPSIDRNRPLERYRKVDTGAQVAVLYQALSSEPPDLEKLVATASSEYRDTRDAFKRKDIVTRMAPALEADLAKAKQDRYFWIEMNPTFHDRSTYGGIDHYDFKKNGFPVKLFRSAKTKQEVDDLQATGRIERAGVLLNMTSEGSQDAPGLTLNNWESYRIVPAAQETAKAVEELVTKNTPLKLRLYLYATEAARESSIRTPDGVLRAEILKLQIVDPKDNVLIEH